MNKNFKEAYALSNNRIIGGIETEEGLHYVRIGRNILGEPYASKEDLEKGVFTDSQISQIFLLMSLNNEGNLKQTRKKNGKKEKNS